LVQLQALHCSGNGPANLGPLAGLTQLQVLDCGGNQLTDLGPLAGLTQLQWLNCGGNQLTDLTPLANLTQLQALDCRGNQLTDLTPLANLTQLQVLECCNNQLTDLTPLAGLIQLQKLGCWNNQLTDLGPLAGLTQLQWLNCGYNQLTDLEPLAGLTQLQQLYCSDNQLTDLTPLAGLTQLQGLECSHNQLTDLTPLANLTQLQVLECSYNGISDLNPVKPAVLAGRIDDLLAFNNPVRSLPAELLGSGEYYHVAEELRDYWQELEQGAEPNRDVKVILIGNGCVGKTTLAYALRHRCRPPEQIIERTHGIVINTLEWQIPEDEQPIKVQLWDFGGQEIYHATHRLFLHRNALYLLLWVEETDEAPSEMRHPVSYWSSLIHDLAADSPVILIKNQIDRSDWLPRPADLDTSAIFAQELKISALHYQGIETLRAAIGEQLQALKDCWSYLIPRSWLRLKEALANRQSDKTLSRAHYAQLCIQHGVQHADTLLGYLHESGFLFYRQDRFGDQLILDQNWIINIIYRLLDPAEHIRKRLIRQSGVFSGDDTGDFWREYSLEEREIFTDFMLNCEMAFMLDEDDRRKDFNDRQFVLPALLPQMPPLGVKVWGAHQPGEWWLDFSYPFLHRALIERLIVRTARLSPDRDWWRNGILLSDDETGCRLLLQYQPVLQYQPESTLSQVIRLRICGQQKTHAYARISNPSASSRLFKGRLAFEGTGSV